MMTARNPDIIHLSANLTTFLLFNPYSALPARPLMACASVSVLRPLPYWAVGSQSDFFLLSHPDLPTLLVVVQADDVQALLSDAMPPVTSPLPTLARSGTGGSIVSSQSSSSKWAASSTLWLCFRLSHCYRDVAVIAWTLVFLFSLILLVFEHYCPCVHWSYWCWNITDLVSTRLYLPFVLKHWWSYFYFCFLCKTLLVFVISRMEYLYVLSIVFVLLEWDYWSKFSNFAQKRRVAIFTSTLS